MTVREILRHLRAILADETSNFRTPSFPEITQREQKDEGFRQRRRQAALLLLQVGLTSGFIDHPETTRAKILSKFDRAIALAAEN